VQRPLLALELPAEGHVVAGGSSTAAAILVRVSSTKPAMSLPTTLQSTTSTRTPGSRHMGETHETRIREFLEENDVPVVGLREGAILHVDGHRVVLQDGAGARIFRRDREPVEVAPVADLQEVLG
jgi:peptidase E